MHHPPTPRRSRRSQSQPFFRAIRYLIPALIGALLMGPAAAAPDYRIQPGSGAVTATNLRRHLDFSSQVTLENLGDGGPGAGIRFRYEFVALTPAATRFLAQTRPVPSNVGFNAGGSPIINTPGNDPLPLLVQVDLKPNATMPLGDYKIELTVDPDMEDTDSNRSNNVFVLAPNVTLIPTADLGSTILTLVSPPNPIEYDAGENLVIRTSFKNLGDIVDIGASTADFYLIDIRPDPFLRITLLNQSSTHYLGARVTPAIPAAAQSPGADYTFDSTFTFPGNLNLLNYNMAVVLNPNGTVPEPPEADGANPGGNYTVSVEQLRVEYVHERPDFEGQEENIPVGPDLAPGEFHTFTGRVSNISFLPSTGTTTIHHYFSPFQAPGSSILLGTSTLPPLGPILSPTQHHDFSVNLQIPAGMPSGDYTYFFRADEIGVIPERSEENNIGRINGAVYTVTSLGLPDITTAQDTVSFSPTAAESNDSLSLGVALKNVGELPTGPFDLRFYMVTPGAPISETGTVLAVTRSTAGIAAGQTSVINTTTSVPPLPPGDYKIRCAYDINDEVTEVLEGNLFAGSFTNFTLEPTTPAGMPDLVPTDLTTAVTEAEFDESVSLTVQISNIGSATAPANVYRVALSPDPFAGGTNDIVLGVGVCPAIDPGNRADIPVTLDMPPESSMPPAGTHYWVVKADSGTGVAESDETNNELVFTIPTMRLEPTRVDARPAVSFESAGVSPDRVVPGDRVAPTARIENTGTFTAGQLKVNLYLSVAPGFTPGTDVLLHEFDPVDLPGLGGSMDYSALPPIPADTAPGNYFVLWVIDPFSEVPRDNDDPVVSAHPLTVRERRLRAELLEITPDNHRIALFDTDPNENYLVEFSTDFTNLEATDAKRGIAEFPLVFDVPTNGQPFTERFFRGLRR